jgi:hypothetical protein
VTSDPNLQIATHEFLHQINQAYKCLEVPNNENAFSSKFSVSGRKLIQAINEFNLKAFTKTSAHLQRAANRANLKIPVPKQDADESDEENESPSAVNDESVDDEEGSVVSGEEIEHNIFKISFNYQPHSKALISLLSKAESER